jgi:hypothetical protein|eukprot:COSAG01_NODE_3772_length_5711_cov_67.083393_5_plen_60_part_00
MRGVDGLIHSHAGALSGWKFDVVHSVIVLQHMLPPLQQVYLEQMCDALRPGGHGWIQIP